MNRYTVKDQMFVVPVNTVLELSSEDVKLHGQRLVEVESGHLTIAPLFLKPGVTFGMDGELPRAITMLLDPVEEVKQKRTKKVEE